jgi:hypothetical protein
MKPARKRAIPYSSKPVRFVATAIICAGITSAAGADDPPSGSAGSQAAPADLSAPAGDLIREDLKIENLPRAETPTGRSPDDAVSGATGSVVRVPPRRPRTLLNPNSCASRAQASASILDLIDRVTAGVVRSGSDASSARSDMAQLQDASQRLSRNDVAGACAIVSGVRKRYPVRPN